jgi:seryl-tRNA synthetase
LASSAGGLYAQNSTTVQGSAGVQSSAAYRQLSKKYQKLEAQMQKMAKEMETMHQQQLKLQKQIKKQATASSPKNFAEDQKRIHRRIRDLIRRMNRESGRLQSLESKNVRLLIAGDINTQLINRGGSNSTFYADASPMIQVRVDKHMFANVAFDFYTQGGQAGGSEADIGAANINYLLNNYMTLGAGLITSPIGGIVGNYNTAPWNRWLVDG